MFIKLTRLDNSPIWLNAAFIVTVESRKGGGTIVVPIGDGLDYEVRETAEAVLGMLGDAPAPTVVPVPAPKGLTKTPDDVSPDRGMPDLLPERPASAKSVPPVSQPAKPEVAAPADKPAESPAKADASAEDAAVEKAEPAKPAKRTRKTTATKAKTAAKPRKKTAAKKEAAPEPKPLTPLVLDEGQVERLKKMSPRSIRKLANTLMAQFKVGDPFEAIRALEEREFFKTEGDRVLWPVAAAETEKPVAKE